MPARPHRCRLAQGFHAEGNEFSYYMLLASAYMLNGVERALQARRRCLPLPNCYRCGRCGCVDASRRRPAAARQR